MQAVSAVQVERIDRRQFRITWSLASDAGQANQVVISAGSSPDEIDHTAPVAVIPADARQATVALAETWARPYFHLGADGEGTGLVAAERLVPLEGTMNFRDLGGYRNRDGDCIRWGRVFRSDSLSTLSEADLEVLAGLGLRVIHDFRYEVERDRAPGRIPVGGEIEMVHLPIGGGASEAVEVLELVLRGEITELDVGYMEQLYRRMVIEEAPAFGALMTSLAAEDRLPALFHCTAGKDRTGVAAALLLDVLGVDEDLILDDYELTTRYRSARRVEELRPRLEAAGVDVEKVRPYLTAPRPALEAALAEVSSGWGSAEAYLREAGGVESDAIDRLSQLLIAGAK